MFIEPHVGENNNIDSMFIEDQSPPSGDPVPGSCRDESPPGTARPRAPERSRYPGD